MIKGLILCFAFMLLACSSAFALNVSDLKPDEGVGDLRIVAPYTLYKEESSSTLLDQPFLSYEDVTAYMFVYNSSTVDTPKGYELVVIFEEWGNELDVKNRFEKDFRFEEGFKECVLMFTGRVKKCEKIGYPQIGYILHYQNFIIRLQPYPDYSFTDKELFYLSYDMQKLIKNIFLKISKFETFVEEEVILEEETTPVESSLPAEKQVSEEPKQGFFSRNKHYILGGIGIILMIFWLCKTKHFSRSIFFIILGMIIFNGFTVFTRNEAISWALLWIITYFFFEWFYVKNIKKPRRVRKEYHVPLEKNRGPRRIFLY